MDHSIIPRSVIALQADQAAQVWSRNPKAPPPPNPYDEHLQPDHFRYWACDFKRYSDQHMAPESEASA